MKKPEKFITTEPSIFTREDIEKSKYEFVNGKERNNKVKEVRWRVLKEISLLASKTERFELAKNKIKIETPQIIKDARALIISTPKISEKNLAAIDITINDINKQFGASSYDSFSAELYS